MATQSSILAWKIPWTEEPGGPQSVGLKESDAADARTRWFSQHRSNVRGTASPSLDDLNSEEEAGWCWVPLLPIRATDLTWCFFLICLSDLFTGEMLNNY